MIRRKSKPVLEPTAIDGLITAISPALIIGMIASLVFFLVIAFYRGQYDARLMYILGLFTLATVLIARIAIDNGRAYANAFSVPLAIAAMLAMLRFVTVSGPLGPFSWVVNMGLLGIAWYLADRITFDCTHVDDRQESLQQGLLQSLKLVEQGQLDRRANQPRSTSQKTTKNSPRRHNPGVWVLYFALLALPLFGLGQIAIPDQAARNQAFKYLVGYLACALGLLLTTSFVGMRRYARQRGIEMPSELNRVWLGVGAAGIAAILIACLILPLPSDRGLRLAWLPVEFTAPEGLQTNRWGWGDEGQAPSASSPDAKTSQDESAAANGAPQANGKGPPQAAGNAAADAHKRGSEPGGKKQQESASSADRSDRPRQSQDSGKSRDSGQSRDSKESAASRQAEAQDQQSTNDQPANNSTTQPARSDQRNRGSSDPKSDAKNPAPENQTPENQPKDSGQSRESASQPEKNPPANEKNRNQPKSDQQAENQEQPRAGQEAAQQSSSASKPSPATSTNWMSNLSGGWLTTLFKWLTILVLAGVVLVYVVTHPRELAKLWQELLNMLANLFGNRRSSQVGGSESELVANVDTVRRPFSAYPDPFVSQNTKYTPQQIIEHTFTALEAWAAERGRMRTSAQTAGEFASQLTRHQPQLGRLATSAALMLDRVMFAGWRPTTGDVASLAKLWQVLRQS